MLKSIWPAKGRAAIVAWSGAGAVIVLVTATALAWPALTRPEPPSEAVEGRDGVRISLVQPPKATTPQGDRLDVGAPETALTIAQGSPQTPATAPPASRPSAQPPAEIRPASTTPLLVDDDAAPPVRDWEADDRYEAGQRRRWEAEQQAREDRAERRAQRRAERARQDGDWDDRGPPPEAEGPPSEDRAPPPRW